MPPDNPAAGVKWYLKTSIISFATILIAFFIMLIASITLLPLFHEYGVGGLGLWVTIILIIAASGAAIYYLNRKFVPEWHSTVSRKSIIFATAYVIGMLFVFALVMAFPSLQDDETFTRGASIIFLSIFLIYVYLRFVKK